MVKRKRIKTNLGASKAICVCAVLLCGVIVTPHRALHAQQASDLPSKPEPAAGLLEDSRLQPMANSRNSSTVPAQRLTFSERVKIYEHSFLKPESLIGPALGAGIGQWRDIPPEWGQGADGYGRRFASGFGRSVIARTIAFGVAAADGEDSRFVPSGETGIWRRTRHAITATFVSRTPGGGSMPAFSRFAGAYSAGFIANAWEPRSANSTGDALERGSTALLSSVGWHVFQEFWPDIRTALHHQH